MTEMTQEQKDRLTELRDKDSLTPEETQEKDRLEKMAEAGGDNPTVGGGGGEGGEE